MIYVVFSKILLTLIVRFSFFFFLKKEKKPRTQLRSAMIRVFEEEIHMSFYSCSYFRRRFKCFSSYINIYMLKN